eukprot:5336876-Amphidinium_carterae.1
MRCVLDSDEGRFGGHMRLEHGHSNPFQPQEAAQGRNHSVKMYLPSRTAQVLVRESLLQGGITLNVDQTLLTQYMLVSPADLSIQVVGETTPRKFGKEGRIQLLAKMSVEFTLLLAGKEIKNNACLDGMYNCYYPGHYALKGVGYLEVLETTQPTKTHHGKFAEPSPAPVDSAPTAPAPAQETSKEKVAAVEKPQVEAPKEQSPDPKPSPTPKEPPPSAPQVTALEQKAATEPPVASKPASNKPAEVPAPVISRPPPTEIAQPASVAVPTQQQPLKETQKVPEEKPQAPKEKQLPETFEAKPPPPLVPAVVPP